MSFSEKTLTLLVLLSLGLSALSIFVLVAHGPRGRMRQGSLSPDKQVRAALKAHAEAIGKLQGAIGHLVQDDRRLGETAAGALQRVGLVRYDAFDDMAGQLSFSAALLNASGDGLVITSINGRADTRCYAKPVAAGASAHNLSEEELEAIGLAMRVAPGAVAVAG